MPASLPTLAELLRATHDAAYKAGYDCAVNGPNEKNTHFEYFGTRSLTNAWENGKRDGEAAVLREGDSW